MQPLSSDFVINYPRAEISGFKRDPDVGAVIVSFTPDFDYNRIAEALQYLMVKDVIFLATETDATSRAKLKETGEKAILPCTT